MGLLIVILVATAAIIVLVIFIVLRLRNFQPTKLEDLIKKSPELKNIATSVRQLGATHYEYVGTGIVFYRIHDGKTEIYTAEYSHELKRFETMWSHWQAGVEKIPEHALAIPDVF